jgi:hypothetical protein
LRASGVPITFLVQQLKPEAWANGDDGAPLGRELEVASLLSFIKNNGIRNSELHVGGRAVGPCAEGHPAAWARNGIVWRLWF